MESQLTPTRQALNLFQGAQKRRVLATEHDPIREDFDLEVARQMEREGRALLKPSEPLTRGVGGEVIPRVEDGLPGLDDLLKKPDLVSLHASMHRSELLERAGVTEIALETASQAKGPVQKMITHQMAAAHSRAMSLIAESQRAQDPDIASKKARVAARMMEAFSRAALTLQRLQQGASQVVQVQHVQVNGQAIIGQVGGFGKKVQNPFDHTPSIELKRNRGGRPPTNGHRTKAAITQRQADKRLIESIRSIK